MLLTMREVDETGRRADAVGTLDFGESWCMSCRMARSMVRKDGVRRAGVKWKVAVRAALGDQRAACWAVPIGGGWAFVSIQRGER